MDACANDNLDYVRLCARQYPAARRRAVLSVVPGLGQLRNGEIAKGWLFLAVTASQVVFLACLLSGDKLAPLFTTLAGMFQRQPNWSVGSPFHNGFLHSPAFLIYAGLMLSFVAYAIRDAYDRAVQIIRDGRPAPPARLTLPEATSGSYLFHFALIAAFLMAVIVFVAPAETPKQITDIVLEKAQPQQAHKSAPPKQIEKHQAVKPKPVVQPKPIIQPKPVVVPPKPVKVEKPLPNPVAVAVPTKEPTPLTTAPVEQAAPPAAPAAAAAASGSPGTGSGQAGTGTGSGDGEAEVDMGPYMRDLQRRIKAHWFPPKGNENKRIKVSFKIFKDGHITRLKLVSSSGVSMADDAAMQAVQEAAPFASLPNGVGDDVDINFTFDYHVFGAGGAHAL